MKIAVDVTGQTQERLAARGIGVGLHDRLAGIRLAADKRVEWNLAEVGDV